MADIRAAERSRAEIEETGAAPIPWEEVDADLGLLAEDPRLPAATRLVGGAGEWRARTGDYRIVYENQ